MSNVVPCLIIHRGNFTFNGGVSRGKKVQLSVIILVWTLGLFCTWGSILCGYVVIHLTGDDCSQSKCSLCHNFCTHILNDEKGGASSTTTVMTIKLRRECVVVIHYYFYYSQTLLVFITFFVGKENDSTSSLAVVPPLNAFKFRWYHNMLLLQF